MLCRGPVNAALHLLAALLCFYQISIVTGDSCLARKYTIVPGHTACLDKSADATNDGGVSDADAKLIVDQHNSLRANITSATDMQKMVWDEELAALAQKWADYCHEDHEVNVEYRSIPGRFFATGQNLASGYSTWHEAMRIWFNEGIKLFYGDPATILTDVGHYTQMVWASSSKVGCGYRKCSNIRSNHFYVCNYGPGGNNGDFTKPYDKGSTQCSSCPGKCIISGQEKGLCDCQGIACLNGGTLDLTTCSCSCLQPFHNPALNCALECNGTTDHRQCGSGSFDQCVTNVPEYCPHMCDVCPYAGYGYVDDSKPDNSKPDNSKPGNSAPSLASVAIVCIMALLVAFSSIF